MADPSPLGTWTNLPLEAVRSVPTVNRPVSLAFSASSDVWQDPDVMVGWF